MENDNNGQPQERAEDDAKAVGGEPSNVNASEQPVKEEANGGNHEKDSVRRRERKRSLLVDELIAVFEKGVGAIVVEQQSKRIGVYGVENISSPGSALASARSATGTQDAVLLEELQVNLDSVYNGEIGSPSHSGQQGTPPLRQQTNSTGAPGASK